MEYYLSTKLFLNTCVYVFKFIYCWAYHELVYDAIALKKTKNKKEVDLDSHVWVDLF